MGMELYKKYRPRNWSTVIGQDAIVSSLKNSIKNNTLATAYLFSGGPGSGKTTVAKVLAKTLNCSSLTEDLEPCNNCSTCKAIDSDSQLGVKYISMANAGGVDSVRQLMQEAMLSQPIKKQVFILDEIQNLKSEAQDAMLIGLESEKMNTLFIGCTTDPQKIKPAILSRSQLRTFKPVGHKELATHLAKIAKEEGIFEKVGKEGIINAVKSAKGSVRNALSNLDAIASGGELKLLSDEPLIEAIATGNTVAVLNLLEELNNNGENLTKILEVIYNDFVEIFQIQSGATKNNLFLQEISAKLSIPKTLYALEEIGKTLTSIGYLNVDSKILVSVVLSKLSLKFKQK